MPDGSVARNANMFAMHIPPYPNDLAKLIHLLNIGSSRVTSAVEEVNPTYITKDFELSQGRFSA